VRAGCSAPISTTTDQYGVFLLDGISAFEDLAHVTVEKEGFFTGSRSFVPGENAAGSISYAYITLLRKNLAGMVDGASGGIVALEGVTIAFPAGGFVKNGQPYTGAVSVFLNHIDPTSGELQAQMPGMLMGVMDNVPQLMLSYGMVGVELTDANGQAVQLAPGSPATIRFPVMSGQLSNAPATIPLWWFDDALGYWMQEGEASLVGNEYVGEVAHFSWWNCDVPGDFVQLSGQVLDVDAGLALANAEVVVITQTMGTGTTYTNGLGHFTGLVPIGQELTVRVFLPCEAQGGPSLVHESVIGPFTANASISIAPDTPWTSLVMGTVLDCDGTPVQEGYVLVGWQPVFCIAGDYQFPTCAQTGSLRGYDLQTGNVSPFLEYVVTSDTMMLDDLQTCVPLFGSVTDVEGNTYPTVMIGDQEWMMENLRTGSYANGMAIPSVDPPLAWGLLTDGAWSHYDASSDHGIAYGKIYNWHTVANVSGLCPEGWRVPSDTDWFALETTLGVHADTLDLVGYRGYGENVGGRMKTVSNLWTGPNAGANNESQFSAIPAGYRLGNNGSFSAIGNYTAWWSTSEFDGQNAWIRGLNTNNIGVDRNTANKLNGYCIRCIRD
jgi:uncharacterized protein (TIGR02145 family)